MTASGDAGERIPFDILYCSSEDEPFPVTELLRPDDVPGHRGWQTAKNPKYPQSLVIRFPGDVEIHQLQILSHECKIASKVEVRVFSLRENGVDVGQGPAVVMPSFRDVRFMKLGSVGFNSNEKSKFRSKERKTVHLKATAYFLKLNFQKCHPNALNTNHQVGVYSIACFGTPLAQAPYHIDIPVAAEDPQGDHQLSPSAMSEHSLPPIAGPSRGYTQQPQPPSQSMQQQSLPPIRQIPGNATPVMQMQPQYNGAMSSPQVEVGFKSPPKKFGTAHPHDVPMIPESQPSHTGFAYRSQPIVEFDHVYSARTEELVRLKAQAVDEEEFDAAKEFKMALKNLHDQAQAIYDLEREKVRFIYEEDFDAAKRMKIEMDNCIDDVYKSVPGGVNRLLSTPLPVAPLAVGGATAARAAGPISSRQPIGGDGMGSPYAVGPRSSRATGNGNVVDLPPIDSKAARNPSLKHRFEDEPVRSKYAIAMAQRREEHPSDDEREAENDVNDDQTGGVAPSSNTAEGEGATADVSVGAVDDGEAESPLVDAFEISALPKWEQEVHRCIHSIAGAGEEAPAVPVQAAGPFVEAAECIRVLGNYTTACLLSKRWKLREAAIKALALHLTSLYQHLPAATVVLVALKFLDIKNCGLQDTIGNVFLASCEFVQNVLQDKYDNSRSAVLPATLNLLPRFIARAGDAAQKTREEAATTVIAYACCPEVGVTYVATTIVADPIDQDKRRIPTQNQRVQLARLALLQQLLSQFRLTLSSSLFDACAMKLMLPCLNHSSNEVRDLAVNVCGTLIDMHYDFTKYLHSIGNSAIRTQIQSAMETKGVKPPAPKRNLSAGGKPSAGGAQAANGATPGTRNLSAPRKPRAVPRSDSEAPPDSDV